MYARLTFCLVQPGKLDEAIKVYRDSIVPAAKKQKGFKAIYMLTDRSTGKGISIAMWDTEANMTAGEASGYYREQVAKETPFFAAPPTMERYEVSVKG
jgi:heme-degrading monooxygenase HmoA